MSPSFRDVLDILLLIAAAFAAFGHNRTAKSANDTELIDSQEKRIRAMAGDMLSLRTMCQMQEKRIWRMEINDRRNARLRTMKSKEINYLEQIVRLAVAGLSMTSAEDKKRVVEKVNSLTNELNAYRIETSLSNEEWEEDQTATIALMDRNVDDSIQRQLDRVTTPDSDDPLMVQ